MRHNVPVNSDDMKGTHNSSMWHVRIAALHLKTIGVWLTNSIIDFWVRSLGRNPKACAENPLGSISNEGLLEIMELPVLRGWVLSMWWCASPFLYHEVAVHIKKLKTMCISMHDVHDPYQMALQRIHYVPWSAPNFDYGSHQSYHSWGLVKR